jgi:putative transposase
MARPLRIEYPGAFYHITSRGNERKSVFRSDLDREQFLSYLQSAQERYGAVIHAYCLLNNHYHLLLETPRSNLSQILHHINGAYTTYFNVKRSRAGHLFQGRYRAILVEKEEYAHELSRYIHLNPYRAGLVKNINRYRWSSYPYYLGLKEKPSWLETELILGYFGSQDKAAVRRYRRFVGEGIKKPGFNPLKEVFASTFLGGPDFV